MHGYPLLDLFLTMIYIFLWIMWIFLLFRIIADVFRSSDLSGWGKAGWTLFLLVLPFIGALAYIIVRGASMHTREQRQAEANQDALRQYLNATAGGGSSAADELTKLAALHAQGVLSDEEFAVQKARVLVPQG